MTQETSNPMNLHGRNILVTGASSGIGREICLRLAGLGARLVLVARNQERLQQVASSLHGSGHVVEPYDLQDIDGIKTWIRELGGRLGGFHGLVHSAGVHSMRPLQMLNNQHMEEVMRINVSAALGLVRGFRQKQVHAGGGSIVLLSSVMALVGAKSCTAYAASKGALTASVRSLALELAPVGIRINCVAPGYVRTEMWEAIGSVINKEQSAAIEAMHPLGLGKPEDVAYSVAFLLADTARWITGTTLVVDGGYTAH